MFKRLRQKTVVKFTMWFLIITFVIWGAGSAVSSYKNYAGIIFGRKISVPLYNKSYASVLIRARMRYGDELPKLEKFLDLRSQAWDRLTLLYEAKRRFISSSDREVIEKISSIPFFQRNGLFDKGLYRYIVENVFQTTPREFEESVRNDIIIERLIEAITKDIKLNDQQIREAYRASNELADVSLVLIPLQNYIEKVEAKEEELPAFYEKNKNYFRSPPMVNVIYLKIPFDTKKEESRLLAEEVMGLIKRGGGFEAVSKEYKLQQKESGFFTLTSTIPEIGLSYPFTITAFGLKEKQISDIVEGTDAFYIMKLKNKKEPFVLPFEEVKEKVKNMLIAQKAETLALDDTTSILSQIKNGSKTLEGVAKELNSNITIIKEVTQKKKIYVEQIGTSDILAPVVFSLGVGEVGGPIKIQKGFCLVRLDLLKPIDEDEFKKQKDSFAKTLLEEKRAEFFEKWLLDLKKKAALKDNLLR